MTSIINPPHCPLWPRLPRLIPALPVCMGASGAGVGVYGWVHMWRSEDNLGKSVFSFHPGDPEGGDCEVRLDGSRFCLKSHPTASPYV